MLHDRNLLRILAPEEGEVGLDDVEELHADGRNAAEVTRPVLALKACRNPSGIDPGGKAKWIELLHRGRKENVDSRGRGDLCVAPAGARVAVEIGRVGELGRVHKDRRDDRLALLASRVEESDVALVERAHRRREADRAPAAERLESVAQLGDRVQRLHLGLQFRSGYRAPAAYRTLSGSERKMPGACC